MEQAATRTELKGSEKYKRTKEHVERRVMSKVSDEKGNRVMRKCVELIRKTASIDTSYNSENGLADARIDK